MSLEELKNEWDNLEESVHEPLISNEQIHAIIRTKYRSLTNRVLLLDVAIFFACCYFMLLIWFRFEELNVFHLEALGIFSFALLLLLAIIRLSKLYQNFNNRFLNHSHAVVLKRIAKRHISIQKFYLLNIIIGFLLSIILIVLSIKIYNEYDLIQSKIFWLITSIGSLGFAVLLNRWIKKKYRQAVQEAQELLGELK